MQDAPNTAISNEYRSVPISILVESATNPRKRFDEKNLEELAASMRAQGILAPLLVRELDESKYEVVAGARRLRAAKLAELGTVPVRVVKLTDAESIEAQVVENLQREDIHPLEESLGFKSLLQLGEPTYTIASIAARAGKSEAYVQGRIKLADLIPSVAEAFLKDTIAIGHALLIAKLPDSQQQEAFNAAFRGMWTTDGNSQVLIPVRELAAWIESNILLQLGSAPFDKQDEALVPAAGSCSNCPKRTGFNKLLFADVRKDSCTDPQCFRAKIDAHASKKAWRGYLESLTESGDLDAALRGADAPKKEIASSIDSLLRHSKVYQHSEQFRQMVSFMARFRDYAPYNNMLVRMQNPTCSFYATERDWCDRFGRNLKEDARPMLILAPMHPVMLVYALDETEGKDLPKELENFASYQGEWKPDWLERTVQNAAVRDRIRVDFKILSSTNAGFATLAHSTGEWKMRIAIHSKLDEPSQYGTLCHELAHIYLVT